MTVKVGINGFGRIGRQVLKAIRDYHAKDLEVVAFNDIGDMKTMAHLLKYNSNYGHFNGTVEFKEDALVIDGKTVKAFKETDPAAIFPGQRAMKGTRCPPSHRSRFTPRSSPMLACWNCRMRSYAPGFTSSATSGPLSLVKMTSVFSATPACSSAASTRPTTPSVCTTKSP